MKVNGILIAGIGNIFLGDDGFGVAVVQRLMQSCLPEQVKVVDFGIRGMDLGYALLDKWDLVILVDTIQRDGAPGSLYVVEPEIGPMSTDAMEALSPHSMFPCRALQFARAMGASLEHVRILGCEPARFSTPEEGSFELSPEVSRAVEEAVELIQQMIKEPQPSHA